VETNDLMKTEAKLAAVLLVPVSLLMTSTVRADPEAAIRTAVERAVSYLKSHQRDDGTWSFSGRSLEADHDVGVSALVGLALLESGVPPSDPVIQKAAALVRGAIRSTTATYDLSLAVLFLDRLGQAEDEPLLEAGFLSLAAGQTAEGGWSYTCPSAQGEEEVRRLRTLVQKKNGRQRQDSSNSAPARLPTAGDKEGERKQQGGGTLRTNRRGEGLFAFGDDNSNTQFATLALWVSRRHHLNVDRTLAAVQKRFRKTQNEDGGWAYRTISFRGISGSTASMTCAGLLGLAVGEGVSRQVVLRTKGLSPGTQKGSSLPDPKQDRAVRRGFAFLGQVMERALEPQPDIGFGLRGPRGGPGGPRGFGRGGPIPGGSGNIRDNGLGSEYYFLWSLERVAVLYGQQSVGNKDWFSIGSRFLLSKQQGDGSWSGNLGETVDTCFAIFFLRRVNLALDLTATLRGATRPDQAVNLTARGAEKEAAPEKEANAGDKKGKPVKTQAGSRPAPTVAAKEGHSEPPTAPTAVPPARPALSATTRENEAARLGDQLAQSSATDQPKLLNELREGKGAAYTDALAAAIPRLSGEARTQACEALADRLGRMTAATLRDKCRDSNLEVRRAAALACASKKDQTFVPDLIHLLGDPEPRVWRAARAALKSLTSEDLGPADSASIQARYEAVMRWRDWWAKKSGSSNGD
jgi:HEAT repeats/Prenyltransferase and squalene oxidase repeat